MTHTKTGRKVTLEELLTEWLKIMQDAKDSKLGFDLQRFQAPAKHVPGKPHCRTTCKTISDFHECGTTACGAGFLAMSEFWRSLGGEITSEGIPYVTVGTAKKTCECAIAHVIEQSERTPISYISSLIVGRDAVYGDKDMAEITIDDFIAALQRWIDTGTPYIKEVVE